MFKKLLVPFAVWCGFNSTDVFCAKKTAEELNQDSSLKVEKDFVDFFGGLGRSAGFLGVGKARRMDLVKTKDKTVENAIVESVVPGFCAVLSKALARKLLGSYVSDEIKNGKASYSDWKAASAFLAKLASMSPKAFCSYHKAAKEGQELKDLADSWGCSSNENLKDWKTITSLYLALNTLQDGRLLQRYTFQELAVASKDIADFVEGDDLVSFLAHERHVALHILTVKKLVMKFIVPVLVVRLGGKTALKFTAEDTKKTIMQFMVEEALSELLIPVLITLSLNPKFGLVKISKMFTGQAETAEAVESKGLDLLREKKAIKKAKLQSVAA